MTGQSTDVQWDLRAVYPHSSPVESLFILFLLVVFIVTLVKLVKIWLMAPPFGKVREAYSSQYPKRIRNVIGSLTQWIHLAWLVTAIFSLLQIVQSCRGLAVNKIIGNVLVVSILGDIAKNAYWGLQVSLFAFLVRWHLIKRLESVDRVK